MAAFCVPSACAVLGAVGLGTVATEWFLEPTETELMDMALGSVIILLPMVQLFVLTLVGLGAILTILVFGGNLISMQLLGNTFKMLAAIFGLFFNDCKTFFFKIFFC